MKTVSNPAAQVLPSLSRGSFLKIVLRVLPVMLLLKPAGCRSRLTQNRGAAGYGYGRYGAGKYGST